MMSYFCLNWKGMISGFGFSYGRLVSGDRVFLESGWTYQLFDGTISRHDKQIVALGMAMITTEVHGETTIISFRYDTN